MSTKRRRDLTEFCLEGNQRDRAKHWLDSLNEFYVNNAEKPPPTRKDRKPFESLYRNGDVDKDGGWT